jgi:hypothetical protein
MDLSEVYSKQVNKKTISSLSVGGSFPQIEKDPTIRQLENDVFTKMRSLMPKEEIKEMPKNEVVSISFEDALKELLDFSKK